MEDDKNPPPGPSKRNPGVLSWRNPENGTTIINGWRRQGNRDKKPHINDSFRSPTNFSQDMPWRNPGARYNSERTSNNNSHTQYRFSKANYGTGRGGFGDPPKPPLKLVPTGPRTDIYKKLLSGITGVSDLQEIANSADGEFIINVNKNYEALSNLLKSPIERPDMYVLIMEIISKVCVSSFDQLKTKFTLEVCNSQFIVYLRSYLMDLPSMDDRAKRANQMYWKKENEFWANFITFCECIIHLVPSVAKLKCRSLIEDTSKFCLEKLIENHNLKLPDDLNVTLNMVRENMKTVEVDKAKTRKAYVERQESEPPDNFRQLSVLPTRSDLLEVKPFIRPNVINGAYRDVEHYLDVQFRLLREDCFGPLRDGLFQYMKDPSQRKYDNIRIYHNVQFTSMYISDLKIGTNVEVDYKTKSRFHKIDWSNSKRFIFGSLLLFTRDNCQSFIVATVLDNISIKYGEIAVEIMDSEVGDEIYNNEYYTMIESEVYFEPYQHVLRALQDPWFPLHLAMKKYIVDVDVTPTYPQYLNKNTQYHEYKKFSVMDFNTWPTIEELSLNSSQYEAYKVALTHEFGVIQGPPGTGKTFLGVKIAKTLLGKANVNTKCKMLVVCYTNHALDQFLEALVPFTSSIARIGGQSRKHNMEMFNLKTLRLLLSKEIRKEFYDRITNIKCLCSDLHTYVNTACVLSTSILKLKFLIDNDNFIGTPEHRQLVHEIQYTYYVPDGNMDPMCLWLFENIDIDLKEPVGANNGDKAVPFKKEQNENVCFTLATAHAEIARLIVEYKFIPQENVNARNIIHRMIAKLRGQIRLFQQMREYYEQSKELFIETDVEITELSTLQRWMLYFHWADNVKVDLNGKIVELKMLTSARIKDYEEYRMVMDYKLLSRREVIGMTTSGAARLRNLIQMLGPPIVIVEEAAEVLEQHIITSLTNKCQHLLLIGDHKQLRPSAAHMRLARHFNIEVSLFERMILNDVHSRRLSVQHRMRPEFAALLTPHIYPDLENHPSVIDFPDVRGVATNLFFFTHDHKELAAEDNASKSNPKEADMVLLLANYIMKQGYDASDVTILAAYSGQMFYMCKERIKYPHLGKVKMTLVDNYQGEESKIILLSLVRNNEHNKIGFLGTENRVCVALSRAREGFYMFGNIDILEKNSDLWGTIHKILKHGGHVGPSMRLKCENHPDTTATVSSAEDYAKVPEGGCTLKCYYTLSCGHQCPLTCHPYDREHANIECQMNCERVCELNHACRLKCRQECRCDVTVAKELPCGHTNDVQCHVDPKDVKCPIELDVILPNCGHEAKKTCSVDINDVKCTAACDHRLDKCGHTCTRPCQGEKPEVKICLCDVMVAKEFPCGHTNDVQCHVDPKDLKCPTELDVKLPNCGHEAKKPCSVDINDVKCTAACDHRLDKCGHTCKRLFCHANCSQGREKHDCRQPCAKVKKGCSYQSDEIPEDHRCSRRCVEDCEDCNVPVLKQKTTCGHKVMVACYQNVDDIPCERKCTRMLPCNHICQKKCFQPCGDCDQMIPKQNTKCGHNVIVKCCQNVDDIPCKNKCTRMLPCNHICEKKCFQPCGDCDQMVEKVIPDCQHSIQTECRLEPKRSMCEKRCERNLPCGHPCVGLCKDICDPKKCMMPTTTEIDSPCGHKVPLPCEVFQDFTSDKDTLVLLKHCKAACGATLRCGHACGGTCGGCRQGRLHEACIQRCGRPNFCGHECPEPCSNICPPCQERCEVRCVHSRCTQLCGETCSPCREKCGRACVHTRCTRLCSEPCSRRPCEERCPRPLACAHPCRGFCGEPCPDICKMCRPDDFPKKLLGEEFDDDATFIILEDCGHILESENIERLMNGEIVGVRTCPLCCKPIINTQRYKDRINHMFKTEIEIVKDKQHGTQTKIIQKRKEFLLSVLGIKKIILMLKNSKVIAVYVAFGRGFNNIKKMDLPHLETYEIFKNILKILCEYCHEYYSSKGVDTLRSEMDEQISLMCKYLTVNVGRLSVQQQEDLENELKRVHAIINLSKALNHTTGICDTVVKEAEKNARSVVLSWEIYDHEEAKKVLKHLLDIIKVDYLTLERKLIVKAIGLKAGHWFKCSNGHFYCIGECGGAMQVSKCPECDFLLEIG